jgi:anti-anti-sigma factor
METFRVRARPGSVTCTLELSGEADLDFVPDIIELGTASLAEPMFQVLFLDLAAVTFVDSSALGAFVRLRNMAIDHNKRMVLINIPSKVARVLTMAGLDKVFSSPAAADAAPAVRLDPV